MTKKSRKFFSIQDKKSRSRHLSGFSQARQVGDSFEVKSFGESLYLPVKRVYLLVTAVILSLTLLIISVRVIYLQLGSGASLLALAESNRVKVERMVAPRGLLLDRQMTPMVSNEPSFNVSVIPENLPREPVEVENLANHVSQLLGLEGEADADLKRKMVNARNGTLGAPLVLAEDISHAALLRITLESNLPGLLVDQGNKRVYLGGPALGHIIGYLGYIGVEDWPVLQTRGYYLSDLVGQAGLESYYESTLRGTDKLTVVEINSVGEEQRVLASDQVRPGLDLVLTINLELQQKLYETLNRVASQTSQRAAAVALDPNTGQVLALVSVPGFDSNVFVRDFPQKVELLTDEMRPLFNRAISGQYPPGSTFKPIVAAAALQEGIIDANTTFNSTGGLQVNEWFFPDWQAGGHGRTDVYRAIAESVNTFFYYISGGFEKFRGLGVVLINKYAQAFGLGSSLGIDLPGEAAGFLPSLEWKERVKGEPWYVGDTYHLGIGQGDILITPLQLAAATAVFANGGTLWQPYLLKAVFDSHDSSIISQTNPTELFSADMPATDSISIVRRALREAVLAGSAVSLQALPVTAAGKTGTAQASQGEAHGWFTGWAPYDKPQIVLTVLVENGIGGNTSALPVFREVMNWYFSR